MDDKPKNEDASEDRSGAYGWDALLDKDTEEPPEEYSNPSGIGRGACDTDQGSSDSDCQDELTAQVDDFVMEETKPGFGIPGFEGEEDGGG